MPEAEPAIFRHFVQSSEKEDGGGLEDSDGCSRTLASSIRGMMDGGCTSSYGLAWSEGGR